MTIRRPRRLFAALTLLGTLSCGSDQSGSISVSVKRDGCTASCTQGQTLTLLAYRIPSLLQPCLIQLRTVALASKQGSLDDIPLVDGETFNLAVVATCADDPFCPVCSDTKQVQAVSGTHQELSLVNLASCTPTDPNLTMIFALRKSCQ